MILAALLLAPVVAVLPFKELASERPSAGVSEAIRALLEGELAAVPGLSSVGRAAVDGALAAKKLEKRRTELDGPEAARLAKALGASLVVVGAFEVREDRIKVWARFLEGRRGKVAGTVTAGGPPGDVLLMVNKLAADLARHAGLDNKTVVQLTYRLQPRLRSLKTVELFGEAQLEKDDDKRKQLLQLALNEDPTFTQAARAIEVLELAQPRRDPVAQTEQERDARSAGERLKKRIHDEKDPARISEIYLALFADLQKQRRYRMLISEASAVVSNPPPHVADLSEQLPESALYLIVASYDQLNDDDALLREGQKFLARYPLSDGFVGVRQLVDQALERKKKQREGVRRAADELAALPEAARADACRVAQLYADQSQLKEARGRYAECLAQPGTHDDDRVRLLWIDYHLGDFRGVTQELERLRAQAPTKYHQVMHIVDELPVDD